MKGITDVGFNPFVARQSAFVLTSRCFKRKHFCTGSRISPIFLIPHLPDVPPEESLPAHLSLTLKLPTANPIYTEKTAIIFDVKHPEKMPINRNQIVNGSFDE